MPRSLSGSRIRELRRRAGLTQTALASAVGISPSYLNLIEHNRRAIGGKILGDIAAALSVRPSELSDGGNPTLVADLREAAARTPAETEPAEEFAARFPAWARRLTELERHNRDQEDVIAALSDRLTHDPFLAETVHGILSNVTAIRSTASILAQVADIPPDQVSTFHQGLHSESVRLSGTAQELANYLARAGSATAAAATSEEAVDQFLTRNSHHFDALDQEAEAMAALPHDAARRRLDGLVDEMLQSEAALAGAARTLARSTLIRYGDDALSMPLRRFFEAAQAASWDPAVLARAFAQDLHAVFRRLAVMRRPWIEAPQFGLISVNASGYPLLRKPLPGFALPRHGNACPLWPLFRAFAQPGQPLLGAILHDTDRVYVTLAYASPRTLHRFGGPGDLIASMLLVGEDDSPFAPIASPALPVGTSCRICTRSDCEARAAPQLVVS